MTREEQDTAVQSMRDQGIADACAGREPFAWFDNGALYIGRRGIASFYLVTQTHQDYRAAFAYARAYEAEKGAE